MAFNCFEASAFVNVVLFLIGLPIWAGIYYGIYHPFLSRNWTDDQCHLTDSNFAHFKNNFDYHEYVVWEVSIQSIGLKGYGCFSNKHSDSIATLAYDDLGQQAFYPYQYGKYNGSESTEWFPRWICSSLSERSAFREDNTFNCKWWLRTHSGEADPFKVEVGSPAQTGSFIEVMFKDEVYIPPADYWCLMIFPLGIMTIFTSCLNLFVFMPILLGVCSGRKFLALKDFFYLKILKRKDYIPELVKIRPSLTEGKMAGGIAFLYVYDEFRDSVMKIKPELLRKILEKLK